MDINKIRPDGPTLVIEGQPCGEEPVDVTPEGVSPSPSEVLNQNHEGMLLQALSLLEKAYEIVTEIVKTENLPEDSFAFTDYQKLMIDGKYAILTALIELRGCKEVKCEWDFV